MYALFLPWGHWSVTAPPNWTSNCGLLFGLCEAATDTSWSKGSDVTSTVSSVN